MTDSELKALTAQVKALTSRVEALEKLLERIIRQKPVRETRLIGERTQLDHPPVYVSSVENALEGAIVIERTFVDPPERPDLPVIAEEPIGKDVFGGQEKRRWQIDYDSELPDF